MIHMYLDTLVPLVPSLAEKYSCLKVCQTRGLVLNDLQKCQKVVVSLSEFKQGVVDLET